MFTHRFDFTHQSIGVEVLVDSRVVAMLRRCFLFERCGRSCQERKIDVGFVAGGRAAQSLPLHPIEARHQVTRTPGASRRSAQRRPHKSRRIVVARGRASVGIMQHVPQQSDVRNGQAQRVDLAEAPLVGKGGHARAQLLESWVDAEHAFAFAYIGGESGRRVQQLHLEGGRLRLLRLMLRLVLRLLQPLWKWSLRCGVLVVGLRQHGMSGLVVVVRGVRNSSEVHLRDKLVILFVEEALRLGYVLLHSVSRQPRSQRFPSSSHGARSPYL